MQRIIQINLGGRVLPIEEHAYFVLSEYLNALKRQFSGAEGQEIIEDIESRISELFYMRLQSGTAAINEADVRKVIETLGAPADINDIPGNSSKSSGYGANYRSYGRHYGPYSYRRDRILRDPYNKVIGGVCSGIGHYLAIDPVIVRLIAVFLFFSFGTGLIAYLVCWAIIPEARSREELYNDSPLTFHDITRNVALELDELRDRAEEMSRDLRDFFGRRR
ncbi:MAG: PspC domain-containing protein [Chitinophagia bacterium]|nr:PspC domain-containing protein [Chitinophagia bacterium]